MSVLPRRSVEAKKLERKAQAFLSPRARGKDEVAAFAGALCDLGRAAVIGGMLRDLHLEGARKFSSDIDFVVHPESLPEFDGFVRKRSGHLTRNRFGGHSFTLGPWKADVWPLQRTWARASNHRRVGQLEDCLHTTFFDWDAILYLLQEKRLAVPPDYFERVAGRVIGLNLKENPNPVGNAVRALRYAVRWKAGLATPLAEHVLSHLGTSDWSAILERERSRHKVSYLSILDEKATKSRLRRAVRDGAVCRLAIRADADIVDRTGCKARAESPIPEQPVHARRRHVSSDGDHFPAAAKAADRVESTGDHARKRSETVPAA